MAGEYAFTLQRVTKQYDRVTVLDDITLAFFFGAKIGVIGGNGTGKSTLLRVMAGIDTDVMGDASHARNALARVSQHGTAEEKATVRAKVHAKYPGIGKSSEERARSRYGKG